jgi:glyoxylase-like metal-dependent hydrolase (beta-lactamase superfamily II)
MGGSMQIAIIKPGILIRNNLGLILQASSTVTLICDTDLNIIVDTGIVGEGKKILKGLSKFDLRKEDIDLVINTHLHGDHIGNNALFANSNFIAHEKELPAKLNNVKIISGEYRINERINLIETPGHTPGCISVEVNHPEENRKYVMAGDALPIKDNYTQWVPPGINYNPKIALASMRKIVDIADVIIPGHDDHFFPNQG